METKKRYYAFNEYLRGKFGCRVQKITIDAGLSCPNRDGSIATGGCIYCNQRGSGTGAFEKGLSISRQLETGKAALSRRYKAKKFIAYFQSYSNTYAPLEKLKKMYDEALSVQDIVGLSIGTRPDCINEPVLDLLQNLAKKRLIWVEYGLQSANDNTLKLINRGHNVRCFTDAVAATQNRGIKICAHVILGLPGENRQDLHNTAETLTKSGVDGVKLHLLYVVRGTEMEEMYNQGGYRCMEQEEYVESVCDFLERIPSGIVIQRLTGDPHPEELAAPRWSLQKRETLAMIDETLNRRNSRQGSLIDR